MCLICWTRRTLLENTTSGIVRGVTQGVERKRGKNCTSKRGNSFKGTTRTQEGKGS